MSIRSVYEDGRGWWSYYDSDDVVEQPQEPKAEEPTEATAGEIYYLGVAPIVQLVIPAPDHP